MVGELLDLFGVAKEKMAGSRPHLRSPGRRQRNLRKQSGLVEGIPVVVGAGDTAAGAFGSGIIEAGMFDGYGGDGLGTLLCV